MLDVIDQYGTILQISLPVHAKGKTKSRFRKKIGQSDRDVNKRELFHLMQFISIK